jgi:hypothetical protein
MLEVLAAQAGTPVLFRFLNFLPHLNHRGRERWGREVEASIGNPRLVCRRLRYINTHRGTHFSPQHPSAAHIPGENVYMTGRCNWCN